MSRTRTLLEGVKTFLEASRRSSNAVLAALDRFIRGLDGDVHDVAVFAPDGSRLACTDAGAERATRAQRPLTPGGEAEERFVLAVPMMDARALLSVVYVASYAPLRAESVDAIAACIDYAAIPYAIALEGESHREVALRDALTGLLGAHAFRRFLDDELARSDATCGRRDLCVWFIDADGFKSVNDRFGHRAGDTVLQAMAAILVSHTTPGLDVAARAGGDEFCALIRYGGKSRAIERAQGFCDAVRAHDFGVPFRITTSVGVAAYPYDASDASSLLESADAAMYHSKRGGRDCVSFVAQAGSFEVVRSEAANQPSRRPSRCRLTFGESFARRSSR